MKNLTFDIGSAFGSPFGQDKGISDLVSAILSNAVAFAGIIVFLLFLLGGIAIIIGSGQAKPESVEKGKKAVTAAIIGFIIIFTSYWIVRIIERVTGVDILQP